MAEAGVPIEAQPQTETAEGKKFTDKQRKELFDLLPCDGVSILTGQSLESLIKLGRRIHGSSHREDIYGVTKWQREHEREFGRGGRKDPFYVSSFSRRSEVITVDELFKDSNQKTIAEQQQMVNELNQKLDQKVKGVKVVLGNVADHAELAFSQFDELGGVTPQYRNRRLIRTSNVDIVPFTERYSRRERKRVHRAFDGNGAVVGNYTNAHGLQIGEFDLTSRNKLVWIRPMIVPA